MSDETESVVALARLGDCQALEAIFLRYDRYLHRVVGMRMVPQLQGRLDPSDVVQEAHLEAVRRVNDYVRNPDLPLRLWLRQIAVDRLNMAIRAHLGTAKRDVNREIGLPDKTSLSIAKQLVAGLTSPSRAVAQNELAKIVRETIENLTEQDREIILLQNYEGLTSTESAQVLNIEPSTARKRYGRALLRLREELIRRGLRDSQP